MIRAEDVIGLLTTLSRNGVDAWVDGGWGVDALVGEETRPHDDLDLVVAIGDSEATIRALGKQGFWLHEDERPTRFLVKDASDRRVDFHTVTFDEEGGGDQVLQDGSSYRYPPEGFNGTGRIGSQEVSCLTAAAQVECHVGYEPDANDFHDMRVLRDRLGVEVPPPYRK